MFKNIIKWNFMVLVKLNHYTRYNSEILSKKFLKNSTIIIRDKK